MKINNQDVFMKKPTVIMVPYPAQGHVTPMLNLASALSRHGFSPVVVTPEFIHSTIAHINAGITCKSIPDGLEEETPRDFFSIEFAMENNMPEHLEGLVRELNGGDGGGVAFMIVDLLASWALKVGGDCGVPVVGYWPVMFAAYQLIAAIPEMLSLGIISETGIPQNEGPIYLGYDQPPLGTQDLPWLIGNLVSRKSRFKFWTRTLARTRTLSQILVNSFPEEHHIDTDLQDQSIKYPNITPIGPLTQHTRYGNPRFSKEDMNCLDWLDQQSDHSVVYISFGTWVSPIGKAKVRNLAMALESSKHPFIWVLGSKWREGLPKNYVERMWNRGRVVSWAPQSEVLRHKGVGCYLTHCGWNSTIEAIQSKVRLLCYPIAGDQFVNCDYIVKIWRIGIRMNDFGEENVHRSLEKVMGDIEMEERLVKMNQRVFGTETSLRVIANLTNFVDDYSKVTNDQTLTKES
ncbi:UDP-glycosyltransferase 82A1 [Lactuca sativa]|uniref:UDP-glycosyltransferase 82A1 n=1 Tax=Lactuca sativa TaxID=4236 RepID=UPI000CD960AC|nr:UDP-glycosyltransferase 82A1 [Lactuca sativa]